MTDHLLCFPVRQIRHPKLPFFLPEALVLGAEQEIFAELCSTLLNALFSNHCYLVLILLDLSYLQQGVEPTQTLFLPKLDVVCILGLSLNIYEGEVLGLLGPNGAGKSTAMKMITGETTLTAGQGNGATSHLQDHAPSFLGYCPQEDPLWPDLTVHQHLQVYAAVKGVPKEDTAAVVNRIVNALQLQDHLKEKSRKLSAGITRKLCIAMCMLSNPAVLLLDEPSAGMDPKGQRCVCLTYLSPSLWALLGAPCDFPVWEAEDDGASMVSHTHLLFCIPSCRCIGSVQHLKNRFGKGYVLEIKVKDPEHTELLHAEVLRIFPGAARQERFPSLLVYKVPMEDALPLSQSFSRLEEAKRNCSLEDYSFSLNTLAQVGDFKAGCAVRHEQEEKLQ
uniref:Uncharacterized protein n=1 Tax=Melopsittacus undulatus TaxID=13146 RepID=A0A8V5G677_MELUD